MSNFYGGQPAQPGYPSAPGAGASNLQFQQFSYGAPTGNAQQQQQAQGQYGFTSSPGFSQPSAGGFGGAAAFGAPGGVSGRMGEQGGLRTGWIAAFSTEGYDGEPPLLEELGVNFGHIQAKTLAVLNPFRHIDQHLMDDSDLAGPLLFFLLFGFFLLFSGKVHFGYIYGLAVLGCASLHTILSLMSPVDASTEEPQQSYPQYDASSTGHGSSGGGSLSSTLTIWRSSSVLGYCLLPLLVTSGFGILMPMDTPLGIMLTALAICWCTYSASGMFCAVGRMRGMRFLVAYPLGLFYVGFGIMGIFSSRGAGSMANAAAKLT